MHKIQITLAKYSEYGKIIHKLIENQGNWEQ